MKEGKSGWCYEICECGQGGKLPHPFSPLALLKWNQSLAYGGLDPLWWVWVNIFHSTFRKKIIFPLQKIIITQFLWCTYFIFILLPTFLQLLSKIHIMSHCADIGARMFNILCAGCLGTRLCSRVWKVSRWTNPRERNSWFSSWRSPPGLVPHGFHPVTYTQRARVECNSASHASAFYAKCVRFSFFSLSQMPKSVEKQRSCYVLCECGDAGG